MIEEKKAKTENKILPAIIFIVATLIFSAILIFALPTATYVSPTPANNTNQSGAITINVTSDEALDNATVIWVNSSGKSNITMSNNTQLNWYLTLTTAMLEDGRQNWTIIGTNITGNRTPEATPFGGRRTVFSDNTYPVPYIDVPTNTTYIVTNTTLNYTVTDTNIDGCWYSITSGTNVSITSCANITFTASEGSTNLTLWANDTAGNENLTSIAFYVDSIHPAITVVNPTNNSNKSVTVNFNVTISEAVSTCQYSIGGDANVSMTNNGAATSWGAVNATIADGRSYNLTYSCNDTADNWNNTRVLFQVDSTYPHVNLTASDGSGATPGTITFTYATTDTYIDSCEYNITKDGSSYVSDSDLNCSATSKSFTASDWATYKVTIWVNDTAGNANSTYVNVDYSGTGSPDGGSRGGGNGEPEEEEVVEEVIEEEIVEEEAPVFSIETIKEFGNKKLFDKIPIWAVAAVGLVIVILYFVFKSPKKFKLK